MNIKGLLLLGAGLACQLGAASPLLIKNEDNEHIFMVPKQIEISEKGLIDYVDFMTRGKALTHLFFCACGQRASFDSEAWEPIWYGFGEKDYDGKTNSHPWKASAKRFHDMGVDPYKVMVRRARENGVSPWMSMRMNDIHFVTSDKLSRTASFWRNHPEFRIYPDVKAMGSKRPWTDFTLDFAHKEVRDYNFAMARELLTRYDGDGLELDFMRCVPCLRYEHAEEDAHFLTEFVRRVKKAANRAAEERDHPVGLAVRVPQNLRCAHQLGFEVEKWVEEKLVDIVILSGESAAYFELDYQQMASALKAKNPQLKVVPMIDRIQCNDESFPLHINLAGYRGWADAMHAKNVDGLYLFNLEYSAMDAQKGVYAGALSPENAAKGYRRYFTTCDDVANKILKPKEKSFLPVGIDKAVEIAVQAGGSRPEKQVEVILGFDSEEVPAGSLAVKLNGREALGCVEEPETEQYCGAKRWIFKRSLKVYRWSFPLDAFVPGINRISYQPVEGAKARIIWSEIALDRETAATADLAEIETALEGELRRLAAETKVDFGEGFKVSQPCAPGHYRGFWPDDWYFPHKLMPELITDADAHRLFVFLTEHIENAPTVPDRIEPDGALVFQPGSRERPHGTLMPVHLPAAWLRLVRYLHERTGDDALKERWRGVIGRSVDKLVVRDGLPFVSDTEPQVAFGFYDTVGLQGNELMTAVVLEKGLRHAKSLFGGELGRKCERLADGIAANIGKMKTEEGWFLSDTLGCRQFSAWANGLLYGARYISEADKREIRAQFDRCRKALVLRGQVRHTTEEWKRMNPVWKDRPAGTYMNGGYWAVGTAYVLAAYYDIDGNAARMMLRDMMDDLRKTDFAEWTDAEGKRLGARKFLMSVALPLAAVRAIRNGKALVDEF